MRLSDALLLEPPAPIVGGIAPLEIALSEIWISDRTDSRGSGTQSDPFSGAVITGPAIAATFGTTPMGTDSRVALVNVDTAANGLTNGDVVTIVPQSAGSPWSGTFPIYDVTASSFRYYMQSEPSPATPPTGTVTVTKLRFLFDEVMAMLPANCTVHIGKGLLLTRGHGQGIAAVGWTPKSGQRILGSGMEVTVLRLVYVHLPRVPFHVIKSEDYLAGFEAWDMTLDANLTNQLVLAGQATQDFAEVCCGGIAAEGRDVKISQVRVINFGTHILPIECFVNRCWGHTSRQEVHRELRHRRLHSRAALHEAQHLHHHLHHYRRRRATDRRRHGLSSRLRDSTLLRQRRPPRKPG